MESLETVADDGSGPRNNLASVEECGRVDGMLHQLHESAFRRICIGSKRPDAFDADAMFGGERTAKTGEILIQDRFDGDRAVRRQRAGMVEHDVEIAVGEMAEHKWVKRGVDGPEPVERALHISVDRGQRRRDVIRAAAGNAR